MQTPGHWRPTFRHAMLWFGSIVRPPAQNGRTVQTVSRPRGKQARKRGQLAMAAQRCTTHPDLSANTVGSVLGRALIAPVIAALSACSHSAPAPLSPEEGPLAGELVDAK